MGLLGIVVILGLLSVPFIIACREQEKSDENK